MPELRRWRWGEPVEPLAQRLATGEVLAIPTESSYGLAVDPRNRDGVETIYRIKSRERGKPLLVLVADLDQALRLGVRADLPELEILRQVWPAPLTAVLPLAESRDEDRLPARAGCATLAIRVPAHTRIRRLIRDVGCPLTATSANRAGEAPVLEPDDLEGLLRGFRATLIDDGPLPGGPPSTLVQWSDGQPRILRAGAFDPALLQQEKKMSYG